MLLQPGGVLLTPRIAIALRPFIRRAVRHGYCAGTTPTLSSLSECDKADQALFDNIITNSRPTHPLHILLPPKVEKHYSTVPAATVINFHVKLQHLTKAISFIVYYIVTFLPAGCREAATCRYCFYSVAKNQHFAP